MIKSLFSLEAAITSFVIFSFNNTLSSSGKITYNSPFIDAVNQIKEKEYVEKFRKEHKDRKVLAVAICYNSKNKEHHCKIEEIN